MLEAELMELDHWPKDELLAYQATRVRALLTHAVNQCPPLPRGAGVHVPERLRQAVIAAVTSTGAVAPAVDVQPVPAVRREPGGKLRLVRSA